MNLIAFAIEAVKSAVVFAFKSDLYLSTASGWFT